MIEFKKQYLTYEQYRELGGTLDMTPFNILELEAQKNIDKYTFGRLKNLDEQINEVKTCDFALINLLEGYSKNSKSDKSISSESIDGYSVSYNSNVENISKIKVNEIKGIIKSYLSECYLEDGTPYLYTGATKYDNK